MRDVLPDEVVDAIAEQYRAAARDAVEDYEHQRGDEDSLTGAFGTVLRRETHGSIVVGTRRYTWRTTSRKLRGRGPNSPEHQTGMDALIELRGSRSGRGCSSP